MTHISVFQKCSLGFPTSTFCSLLVPTLNPYWMSQMFPQVTFYHFSHGNNSATRLALRLRTLRSRAQDIILWQQNVVHGFHWRRAEVVFSSLVKAKVRKIKGLIMYLSPPQKIYSGITLGNTKLSLCCYVICFVCRLCFSLMGVPNTMKNI